MPGRARSSGPTEAFATVSIPVRVPPQVAWAYLTAPGQRMAWQPWVTAVTIEGAGGGRRGPGTSNHCMHGKDAVVEEIVDWRPFDYVTDRTVVGSPGGPVKVPHTIEFEPTAEGTTIHMRFGQPKTARERAAAAVFGPPYEQALRDAAPTLVAQLEAAFAAAEADRGPELEVPGRLEGDAQAG